MKRLLCILILLLIPVICHAAEVNLAWDASVTPTVTHYRVYYGNATRTYGKLETIGNVTEYKVTDLPVGMWFFAVTALDDMGNESEYSNEVSTTIGGVPASPGNFRLVQKAITNDYPTPKTIINK
jgi:hypothetical protein